jgi:polysaccharide pyruvyl transferase WcaK-like protein
MNSEFLITLYENQLMLLIAQRVYRIPTYVVGEQVGPLTNRLDRLLVRLPLERAEAVSLRDQRSVFTARRLLSSPDKVELFGDWAYKAEAPVEHSPGSVPRLGVNLRLAHYSPLIDVHLAQIAEGLDAFRRRTGGEIHLIPTCSDPLESDEAILRELENRCHCRDSIRPHVFFTSVDDCRRMIASMQLNLAVSYHYCLFSLMANVPCLGLVTSEYYAQKLGALFELFGLPEWLVRADSLAGKDLAEELIVLSEALPSHRDRLLDANHRLMEQRGAAAHGLFVRLRQQLSGAPQMVGAGVAHGP